MGINFQKIQEQDHDHLRQIIRSDESIDIKIQRICLWRQEKRFGELRNLLRYHAHQLLPTIAGRVDSGGRGLDFLRDKINLLRQKHKTEKEPTMTTRITISVNGPQGVGKTTFLNNLKSLLNVAIRISFKEGEDIELVFEESNDMSKQETSNFAAKKEVNEKLDTLAALESDRYAATCRMVKLLEEMNYCPKEIAAMANENEAENHNTSCFIDAIRKSL